MLGQWGIGRGLLLLLQVGQKGQKAQKGQREPREQREQREQRLYQQGLVHSEAGQARPCNFLLSFYVF